MKAFEELGEQVARDWRARHHDEEAFAELAAEALAASGVLNSVTLADLTDWLITAPRLPEQTFRNFGQPPINLYVGHKFFIEALLWLDSTTAIHQHSFAGGFGVLAGSSLHSRYRFQWRDRVCAELLLGEIEFLSAELLQRGDVRRIDLGDAFTHALFHLDYPSVSVVVRTHTSARHQPQYSYLKPGVALDPFYEPEPYTTQLRWLESLSKVDVPLFWEAAGRLVHGGDLWLAFKVLAIAHAEFRETAEWTQLFQAARARHGARVDHFLPALEEQRRQANIVARRATIQEPDHRFFLALLLNAPDRAVIYQLIQQRFPGADAEALVLRWVRELSERKLIGLDFDPLALKLLHFALRDATLAEVKAALAGAFSARQVRDQARALRTLWQEIQEAVLLKPLLTQPPRARHRAAAQPE